MGDGPVSYLTASLVLRGEQATIRAQPHGGGDLVAMHVGSLTLQWDGIDQARAFLSNASAALEAEVARYLAERGQA